MEIDSAVFLVSQQFEYLGDTETVFEPISEPKGDWLIIKISAENLATHSL